MQQNNFNNNFLSKMVDRGSFLLRYFHAPPTRGALSMTNAERSSYHDLCREAALRHKWIESEKAGRDLGEHAIYDWIRQYWHAFYRARAFEHLLGTRQWVEMDASEFGILFVELAKQPPLAWPILQQFL